MSRPIKFRAWDKEAKEYCYNAEYTYDFLCGGKGCCSESFGTVLDDERFIVEQYTGLKDKNGKEIYEGDIVKVSGEVALNDDICVNPVAEIVWVDSAAGFGEKFTVKKAPMMPIGLYSYEVIGSIHENPELVGGEE